MDIRVTGAHQLAAVSRALKQHGDKALTSEMTRGITRSVKPLKRDVKAHARSSLPKRGGLAKRVARTSLPHRTRKTGSRAGVRIEAKANAVNDPGRIDRGRIKHPVFGKGPWVLQDVTPGWFTKPLKDGAPVVRKELIKVMDDVVNKIARSV